MAPVEFLRPSLSLVPTAPAEEPPDAVAQVGCEVARALSNALERVNALAATGRIDRHGLAALRDDIEQARRVAMMAQQTSRLAHGRVALTSEPLDLTAMLREALLQRNPDIVARGHIVRPRLQPCAVIGDTTLTFLLLQTLLDWAFEHTQGPVDLDLQMTGWPALARLECRFAWRTDAEAAAAPNVTPMLETTARRLLRQAATAMALPCDQHEEAGRVVLTLEFPRSVPEAPPVMEAPSAEAPGAAATSRHDARSLQGCHVLVVAARRELRHLVREALRGQNLMVDYVTSVEEARAFCRGTLPHALVSEPSLGEAFERWCRELMARSPHIACVQITDAGRDFEMRTVDGHEQLCMAQRVVPTGLPSALAFELARRQ